MPYRRKRKTKRLFYRKKGRSTAVRALAGVKSIRRQLYKTTERKYHEDTISVTPTATAVVTHLTNISQGDTSQQREGNFINLKSITAKFDVVGADAYNRTRVIIFYWKVENVTPTAGDILHTGSDPLALYNPDTVGSFKVIYDRLIMTQTYDNARYRKFYINLRNLKVKWRDSGALQQNHLYMLVQGDSIGVPHPSMLGHYRIRYVDK